MGYVNNLLARHERVQRIARDHWITLLPTFLIDLTLGIVIVGLTVLGGLLSPPWTWLGFFLLFIPLGHLLFRLAAWRSKQQIVTNQRIIQITGMLNTRVSDTPLEKINDIVMEQSVLGRALKFGDLKIISGSESGIDVFHCIADPVGFKKELLEQKMGLADLDAFEDRVEQMRDTEASGAGDVPELITDLDELRKKGLITNAEFEEKKRQLLDMI